MRLRRSLGPRRVFAGPATSVPLEFSSARSVGRRGSSRTQKAFPGRRGVLSVRTGMEEAAMGNNGSIGRTARSWQRTEGSGRPCRVPGERGRVRRKTSQGSPSSRPSIAREPKMCAHSQQVSSPLSDEELRRLDAHWRAANYLSVGQIYLMSNPLLTEPLRARARQAAAARSLGHFTWPQPRVHTPQPTRPLPGAGSPLHLGARSRRPRRGGQFLAGRVVHGDLPGHHPGHRRDGPAVPAVLVPRRRPQPRGPGDARLHPRGRGTRIRPLSRLRCRLRQPRPAGHLCHR